MSALGQVVETGPLTYPAGTTVVPVAGSVTTITTSGNVSVGSGASVSYAAAGQIKLEPGFSATGGGTFHAQITSATSPTITSAASTTFATGQVGHFAVQSTGTTPLTFAASGNLPAWATIDPITGMISGTPPNTADSPFTFTLSATNSAGTATQSFTLVVGTPPSITTQPASQTAYVGSSATFSVSAAGSPPLTYQWLLNGTPITGANNTSYTITDVQTTHAGTYSVIVTAAGASVTSNAATLTVPEPVNDISWQSLDLGMYEQITNSAAPVAKWFTLHVTNTGTKTWTLRSSYSIHLTVTDQGGNVVNTGFGYGLDGSQSGATSTPPGATVTPYFDFFMPSTPGYYTFTFTAYEGGTPFGQPYSVTKQVLDPTNWIFQFASVISSPRHVTAKVGQPFTYQATANPTTWKNFGFSWILLPPGGMDNFSYSDSTGLLTFTPKAVGTCIFNLWGQTTQESGPYCSVMVDVVEDTGPVPVVTSESISIPVGGSVSYFTHATNSPTSYESNLIPGLHQFGSDISGVPYFGAGTYTVGLAAKNAIGYGTGTLTIHVYQTGSPPSITSATTGTATVGVPYSYQITASNAPTSYQAYYLPDGLTVNTSTGLISGTPTTAGSASVSLQATNSVGIGTAWLNLTVGTVPPPSITSSTTASGTIGAAFNYQITATNNPSSYTASGLPDGLSLNTTTGVISGTPTSSGTSAVAISATNPSGTGSATLMLTIGSQSSSNTPLSCTVSASATSINPGQTVTITVNGSDADGNLRYVNVDQLSPNNGYYGAVDSGTEIPPSGPHYDLGANYGNYTRNLPLTLTPYGSYTFRGAVSDGSSWIYSPSNVTVNVVHEVTLSSTTMSMNARPTISSAEPLQAMYKLRAKFITPSGDFHAATSWNNNGYQLDTLPAPGTYTVYLYWLKYDSTGTNLLEIGPYRAVTATVQDVAGAPSITSALSASGAVGSAFPNYAITATNSPTGYNATGLPPGLVVNQSTGVISGTPTTAGTYSVSLTATNGSGSGVATLTITIGSATVPTITDTRSGTGAVGSGFSYQIKATGATSYSASGLPPGLTINPSTGEIYGTPTQQNSYQVTIYATNASGTVSAGITISVAAGDATVAGQFPVDLSVDNKGAANGTIPLVMPVGRAGLEPKLALQYSSQSGNGPLGIGFALSTGYPHAITRGRSILARDGVVHGVNFDADDRFYLDGKRLICVDGTYGSADSVYRTEVDSFVTITAFGDGARIDGFRVDCKDGSMWCFGKNVKDAVGNIVYTAADGFQPASGETTGQALTWALKWVEDKIGNYVEFRYDETSVEGSGAGELTLAAGEHLLTSIRYTGNRLSSPVISPRYVVWLRHDDPNNLSAFPAGAHRPDETTYYQTGRVTTMAARLDDVSVIEASGNFGSPLRTYRFKYDPDVSAPTLLRLVKVERRDAGVAGATTLGVQATWGSRTTSMDVPNGLYAWNVGSTYYRTNAKFAGDFNGDGRTDVLFFHHDLTNYVWDLAYAWRGDDGSWQHSASSTISGPVGLDLVTTGDFDGDGRTDIVFVVEGHSSDSGWYIALATGTGFAPAQRILKNDDTSVDKMTKGSAQAVDLDGDGRDELLFQVKRQDLAPDISWLDDSSILLDGMPVIGGSPESGSSVVLPDEGPIHIARPTFVNGVWTQTTEKEVGGLSGLGTAVSLRRVDLNGDGRSDFIASGFSMDPSSGSWIDATWDITTYLNTGNDSVVAGPRLLFDGGQLNSRADSSAHLSLTGDVNGDGLDDIVYMVHHCAADGVANDGWQVALSKGDGTFDVTSFSGVPDEVDLDGTTVPTFSQRLGDFEIGQADAESSGPEYYVKNMTGYSVGGAVLLDWNGDGRKDFVFYAKGLGWRCYLAGSHGFDTSTAIQIFGNATDPTDYGFNFDPPDPVLNSAFSMDASASDLEGSGRDSLLLFARADPDYSYAVGASYALNHSTDSFRVRGFTDGLGSTTNVQYGAVSNDGIYTPGAPVAYPIRETRHATVVTDLSRDAGGTGGEQQHFSYQYSGARTDLAGRGYLGFHTFVTLDQQTNLFKYQFLAQSFPMTGLTAREETYRYLGSGQFRFLTSHDNTVVFDEVAKSDTDGALWGTVYPFISRAVESRWEDASTPHFTVSTSGASSAPEALFPNARPDGAHIHITAQSTFDQQTAPQTSIPAASGVPSFYSSDTTRDPDATVGTGLLGEYYNDENLTNLVFTRVDPTINFGWTGQSPDPRVDVDTFSVRWTGQIQPRYSETYTFSTSSDDGVRLWVNGQQLVDNWTDHSAVTNSGTIALSAGQKYDIKLEYYQNVSNSTAQLRWSSNSQLSEIIPQSQLFPPIANAVTGVTDFGSIQSLQLPGQITYGNLRKLETDYGDGYTETVATTYKPPVGAMTGLVDTVTSSVQSPNYGTQTAPTKSYTYWNNTPLVATEKIDAAGDKLDLTTTYTRDTLGRLTDTSISGYNSPGDARHIGNYTVSSATSFDAKFDLPTTTKDAAPYQHTTTTAYDSILGLPTTVTDVNNVITSTHYDVLGRPLAVTVKTPATDDPLQGLATRNEYRWTSPSASDWTKTQTVSPPAGFNGVAAGAPITGVTALTLNSAFVIQTTATGGSSYAPYKPTVWTYYDRLGRPIRTIKENFTGLTITDTAYNSLGQAIAVSLPYPQGGTVYWAKTAYDALGRVKTVTAPNGTVTTTTYQGRATLVSVDAPNLGGVDPAAQVNATLVDAKGRTVKVWNADNVPTFTDNSGTTATAPSITFDLDGFGRMRKTTLKDQTTPITANYDDFGHQTELNDPDKGDWFYLNNALGQVVWQKDARLNETTSTFDHLGRQLSRVTAEPGGPTETANWYYYDSNQDDGLHLVANGTQGWIGALERQETATVGAPGYAGANSNAGTLHYYDAFGRPSIDLTTIDNKWFYTYSDYDTYSRIKALRYYWRESGNEDPSQNPDAWQEFGTSYTYDAKSYVLSIADTTASPRTWWQADPTNGYDYLDRPVVVRKGSGYWTKRTYRPEDGVVTGITTGPNAGDTSIQSLGFNYDGLGNLTQRTGAGGTESLGYDNLNRLTSSTKQGTVNYYDNGNIRNKLGINNETTSDYVYDLAQPHAVRTAFGYTMGYDANGNLSSRSKGTESWGFRYAGFDKPRWMTKTVSANGSTTVVGSEFLYDANRSRTLQLEYDQVDGNGVPSHYVRKRVYGLGATLEVNYDNTALSGTTWAMKKVRVYVPGPDGVIGAREFDPQKPQGQQETALVYHYDHLGSIDAITPFGSTDGSFANTDSGKSGRYSEDAWGQRRNPLTWTGAPTTTDTGGATSLTPRGYTGHEMLDDLGLVHMNGRIYDPLLGRFLSADVVVQNLLINQSYNRYSYVLNNPLTFTDPSGFLFEKQRLMARVFLRVAAAELHLDRTASFGVGIAAGYVEGNTGATINTTGNRYATAGKVVGNLVAATQGVLEVAGGGTIAGGGSLVSATGVGAPVGVPAAIGGTALAAHGAIVTSVAAHKIGQNLQNLRNEAQATGAQPKTGSDEGKVNPTTSPTTESGKTSRAARREAMREEGIPTSQQPKSQSKNASGREYSYDVPKEGGGTQTKSVQQQTMDSSHPGENHWEAGTVKTDPATGEVRMNDHGRPKLTNDKTKVGYP